MCFIVDGMKKSTRKYELPNVVYFKGILCTLSARNTEPKAYSHQHHPTPFKHNKFYLPPPHRLVVTLSKLIYLMFCVCCVRGANCIYIYIHICVNMHDTTYLICAVVLCIRLRRCVCVCGLITYHSWCNARSHTNTLTNTY